MLSGQPKAQIILWQQDLGDLVPDLWFVLAHPCQFGRGEARKHDIAGQRPKPRVGVHRRSLGKRPRVIPQDAGAQHGVGGVQQRRAVHMARQTDALHLPQAMGRQLRQHSLGGCDPVGRDLLGPAILRALHGQGRARLGQNLLTIVDQNPLQPRGSQIQTDKHVRIPLGERPKAAFDFLDQSAGDRSGPI